MTYTTIKVREITRNKLEVLKRKLNKKALAEVVDSILDIVSRYKISGELK
jgi:hypothetical protein|tara:strand:+ start:1007 stop:1156 length:150 start_codon:yes stop_codon:yes gene_type:complete